MIWLKTFGGAVVYADDGQPMLGAATQRRTLALLAILAVADDSGISRDKLVGLLWPDRATRRARHSLTQALYAARKSLNCEDLFEGIEDLRLNPHRIQSDVQAFKRALEEKDNAAAAALYRGAFLDGLYLSSTDFERWVDGVRASFEERAVAALKTLAADAEAQADYASAAEHLRQLASVRPADPAVALRLMHALSHAGDPAAAIQRADLHTRIVRDDLELAPDARVTAFADELRRSVTEQSSATKYVAPETEVWEPEPVEVQAGPGKAVVEATPIFYERSAGIQKGWSRPMLGRSRLARRALSGLALVGIVFTGVFLTTREGEGPVEPLQQRIVVAPFRIAGADASLHFLRDGMVELLSTRLADDTTARAVDAGAVLRAWKRAGVGRSRDASNDTVVRMAARLGAERVIVGSVVGTPSHAVVSASVIAANSGEVSGEATVEGPADSLTSLVDRLAGQLLASQAARDQPLSSLTTTSLPALRAFLAASSAFATGDYRVAADHYERALRFDSTFALAAFRLGLAARRMSDFALERKAIAQAWRFRGMLNEQDRTHLIAWAGPQYPNASTRIESIAAWEAAARIAPERADVWYDYAALLSNTGRELEAAERERVLYALERAIELDPAYATPRLLLLRLTGRIGPAGDTAVTAPEVPATPFLAWRVAQARNDSTRLRALSDTLQHLGPVNLRMLAASAQFDGILPDDGLRALRILSSRALSLDHATDFLLAEHSMELNRGQPTRAFMVSRRMQRLSPATRAHLRLRVLDALYAEGDTIVAREAAQELDRSLEYPSLRSAAADACALAQWKLAKGDTAGARRMLPKLQGTAQDEPLALSMHAPLCARLIEAAIAVKTDADDAQRRVLQLDSLVLTSAAVGDIAAFGHIAIARMHRRLGRPDLSLEALRRRPYMSAAWPRYLASSLREEAELAAQQGNRAAAISAYERYLALRTDADPAVKPQLDSVRAALQALQDQQ